jgi:hypothetical protein
MKQTRDSEGVLDFFRRLFRRFFSAPVEISGVRRILSARAIQRTMAAA